MSDANETNETNETTLTVTKKVKMFFVKGFKINAEIKIFVNGEILVDKSRKIEIPVTHRRKGSLIAFKSAEILTANNELQAVLDDKIKLNELIAQLKYNKFVKEDNQEKTIEKEFSWVEFLLK